MVKGRIAIAALSLSASALVGIAGWEQYQVFPETPMRVYAGHETVCYAFPDEAAFTAAAIEAGLLPAPEPVEADPVEAAPNEATP